MSAVPRSLFGVNFVYAFLRKFVNHTVTIILHPPSILRYRLHKRALLMLNCPLAVHPPSTIISLLSAPESNTNHERRRPQTHLCSCPHRKQASSSAKGCQRSLRHQGQIRLCPIRTSIMPCPTHHNCRGFRRQQRSQQQQQ